jgi:hypothetical protein
MTPTGSVGAPFTYQVYANSYASEIGTEELDRDDIDVVTVV